MNYYSQQFVHALTGEATSVFFIERKYRRRYGNHSLLEIHGKFNLYKNSEPIHVFNNPVFCQFSRVIHNTIYYTLRNNDMDEVRYFDLDDGTDRLLASFKECISLHEFVDIVCIKSIEYIDGVRTAVIYFYECRDFYDYRPIYSPIILDSCNVGLDVELLTDESGILHIACGNAIHRVHDNHKSYIKVPDNYNFNCQIVATMNNLYLVHDYNSMQIHMYKFLGMDCTKNLSDETIDITQSGNLHKLLRKYRSILQNKLSMTYRKSRESKNKIRIKYEYGIRALLNHQSIFCGY
jgi:hypothetical protein